MKKVVTFGEIMLRLAPDGYLRFVQVDHLEALPGGGEANVSVSLANYGLESVFVTKLPSHEIGQMVVNQLRRYGVDTSRKLAVDQPAESGEVDRAVFKGRDNGGSNTCKESLLHSVQSPSNH